MNTWFSLSLVFNFIIFLTLLYLGLSWRKLVQRVVRMFTSNLYTQRATMFENLPVKKGSIIFLGDSITAGANWSELFENSNIINRGISGDVTAGVLNRVSEITRHQASKLFIAIGTNDIGSKIVTNKIIANYTAILKNIQDASPKTEIYVQSILPVNIPKKSILLHNNKGILAVNKALQQLCKAMNITYIDLHPHFSDEKGKLKDSLSNDGLHLLGAGYQLWKSLIEGEVNP